MSKIAVIGSNGYLGKPTLEALQNPLFANKVSYPILAFTRSKKNKVDSEKVQWVEATFDEAHLEDLYQKFEGTDAIIELTGIEPTVFQITEKIVEHVKPKVFIPSQFGCELHDASKVLPNFIDIKTKHSANARAAGIKTIDIITSFFAEPGSFLYDIVAHVGIDVATKTATYRGDPDAKFAYATLPDIGKIVAVVATHPSPNTLPDTIRAYSGKVSQREIKEKYESNHNVKLEERHVNKEDALKEGQAKYANFDPKDFLYYLHILVSQGVDRGTSFSQDERELVNPQESLWKWDKL